jgi:hypothetical protein
MASAQVTPDNPDIRNHPDFHSLDNVLGVVYEAAYKYLKERSARAPQDLATFIPFDDHAETHIRGGSIQGDHVTGILGQMMRVKPRSGTTFHTALTKAHAEVEGVRFKCLCMSLRGTTRQSDVLCLHLPCKKGPLSQSCYHVLMISLVDALHMVIASGCAVQWRQQTQSDQKPVIILLTDSGDWHKDHSLQTLRQIMAAEQKYPEDERLTLHMIGFGSGVDLCFVEQLADIGNGSHLVCQTGSDVDRLDLVKAFGRLAAQPALKVSLMHELHGR